MEAELYPNPSFYSEKDIKPSVFSRYCQVNGPTGCSLPRNFRDIELAAKLRYFNTPLSPDRGGIGIKAIPSALL